MEFCREEFRHWRKNNISPNQRDQFLASPFIRFVLN
jgi:hypothetical protein